MQPMAAVIEGMAQARRIGEGAAADALAPLQDLAGELGFTRGAGRGDAGGAGADDDNVEFIHGM